MGLPGAVSRSAQLSLSEAYAKVKPRVESLVEGVQFDHIMYCLPTGLKGIAVAALGSNWSAYNGGWCTSSEALMHEVGHSFGLKHAMWKGDPYGDVSGLMGASSNTQPRKCFNAFDSSMLGWYPEVAVNPATKSYWSGVLTSIADYGTARGARTVILKLGKHHYLLYNRAVGTNRDTEISLACPEGQALEESNAFTNFVCPEPMLRVLGQYFGEGDRSRFA